MKNNWITSSEIIYETHISLLCLQFLYISQIVKLLENNQSAEEKIVSHRLTLSIRTYCAKVFFLFISYSDTTNKNRYVLIYWSSIDRLKNLTIFRLLENVDKKYQCTVIKQMCRRRLCRGITQISAADVAGFDYSASWFCRGIAT